MATICKYRGCFPQLCTSQEHYNRLEKTLLPGCPFKGYTALDLLRDLFHMYEWKIEPGYSYKLGDFLTLCNDVHAEAYRDLLV